MDKSKKWNIGFYKQMKHEETTITQLNEIEFQKYSKIGQLDNCQVEKCEME